MDISELLATTPETLAEKQLAALRKAVVSRLAKLCEHISNGNWQAATELCAASPAGDGHGCDNLCVDFTAVLGPCNSGCPRDIGDVLGRMEQLDAIVVATIAPTYAPKKPKKGGE
jgi:hypothetical protein